MKARISNRDIIHGISGTIYEMHPYHLPENMDKIMGTVVQKLDEMEDMCGHVRDTFKLFEFDDWNAFEKWLRDLLMGIPEFTQLNISRRLKDMGVTDCNDQRNAGISFTSRYDQETQDGRYNDFVDLDACIRNIVNRIDIIDQHNHDCFLCKYAKSYGDMEPSDSETCRTCTANPAYKFNHESHPMSVKPKNQWTEEERRKYEIR